MQQYDGQNIGFLTRLGDSFYRHRLLFFLTITVVIGVTMVALKVRKPTYKSMAQTRVVSDNQVVSNVLGDQQTRETYTSAAQLSVNQFNDLMGDDRIDGFVDAALKSAQLSHPINVDPHAGDPRFALLKKRLIISADSDSLFSIGLVWDDRSDCEKIVAALQAQYIDEITTTRIATAVATTKFLETEIADYERRMRKAEQALIDFREQNAGQSPESQTAYIQQLAALNNQRDGLLISSQDASLKRAALQDRLDNLPPMSVTERTTADGPTLMAIRGLQTKRAALIADGVLPTYDSVTNIDHMIELMKKEAAKEAKSSKDKGQVVLQTSMEDNPEYRILDQQLTMAKIDEKAQISQLALVTSKINEYTADVSKMPAAQRQLNDKTRDYNILKSEYERLLALREQAQLKANLDRITAQSTLMPVGTIFAEETTTKSKVMIMAIGGVFFGLLIGISLVVYSEWTDPTVRYGADVERIFEVPLLSETPDLNIKGARGSSGSLSSRPKPRALLSERR